MKKLVPVTIATACLTLACSHPLEIVNEGDILSASGTRDCYLHEFRAKQENCTENLVTEEYIETYTAVPRNNWVFDRWEGCFSDPEVPTCSFSIPEDVVKDFYFETMPPLRALFRRDGPQEDSARYVYWKFTGTAPSITTLDQEVWIAQTGASTFFPLAWRWSGSISQGGYLGFSQGPDQPGEALVRFSIFNGVDASGDNCGPVEGSRSSFTCTLSLIIDTTKFYRLKMWRSTSDSSGQWWAAWVEEQDETGALVLHRIGRIKVSLSITSIDPASLLNFVNYFGDSVPRCREVPQSQSFFNPPAVNYRGPGNGYAAVAEFDRSETPAGNNCRLLTGGLEPGGAFTRAIPLETGPEADRGVTVFLGGSGGGEQADPPEESFPPRLPDG